MGNISKFPQGLTQQAQMVKRDIKRVDPKNYVSFSHVPGKPKKIKVDPKKPKKQPVDPSTSEDLAISAIDLELSEETDVVKLIKGRTFKSLTIYADKLTLKMKLWLPGTDVTIYARHFYLGKDAQISTKGRDHDLEPDVAGPGKEGADGEDGYRGGNINIYAGLLGLEDQKFPYFITDGGTGQKPGAATPGEPGTIGFGWYPIDNGKIYDCLSNSDYDKLSKIGERPTEALIKLHVDTTSQAGFSPPTTIPTIWHSTPSMPSNGHAGKKPGKPGTGGAAGKLLCHINKPRSAHAEKLIATLKGKMTSTKGGVSPAAITTRGGDAGFAIAPEAYYRSLWAIDKVSWEYLPREEKEKLKAAHVYSGYTRNNDGLWGHSSINGWKWTEHHYKKGKDIAGEKANHAHGKNGNFELKEKLHVWLQPAHVDVYLSILRDAYLAEDFETFNYYMGPLLFDFRPNIEEEAQKDKNSDRYIALSAGLNQLHALKARTQNGHDYFGKPAGWAPNLALSTLDDLYNQSVDRCMKALYIARWFQQVEDDQVGYIHKKMQAVASLHEERHAAIDKFGELNKQVGSLQANIESVTHDIAAFAKLLKKREKTLLQKAKDRVWIGHLLSIAGNLLSIVPIGQPELGMVGAGLEEGAKYFEDTDFDGANAFSDVLTAASKGIEHGTGKKSEGLLDQAKELDKKASGLSKKKYDGYKTAAEKLHDKEKKKQVAELKKRADAARDEAAPYTHVAENLGPASEKIISDVRALCAPEKEVEAQLAKLEQEDANFQDFAKQLRALNAKKTRVVVQLISALMGMNALKARIAKSYVDENVLYKNLEEADQTKISHEVSLVVNQMQERAVDTLIRNRYYLVRAYENLMVKPYPADPLDVKALIKAVTNAVKWKEDQQKSNQIDDDAAWAKALKKLKGVLDTQSREVSTRIIEDAVAGGQNSIIKQETVNSVVLLPEHLKSLNDRQGLSQVCINLSEFDIVPFEGDMAVITDVNVKAIQTHVRKGAEGEKNSRRHFPIQVQHFGEGNLKTPNGLFAARYRTSEVGDPKNEDAAKQAYPEAIQTWTFTYHEQKPNAVEKDKLDDQSKYAFSKTIHPKSGVASEDDKKNVVNFFTKLPAWTEIVIRKADGEWLEIDHLEIEFSVARRTGGPVTTALELREENHVPGWVRITNEKGETIRRMTPCFELYNTDQTLIIEPEYFGKKVVGSIYDTNDNSKGFGNGYNSWKVDIIDGKIAHLRMKLEDAPFGAPREAPKFLDWHSTFDKAVGDGEIKKDNENWKNGYSVSYALRFFYPDEDGKIEETDLGPWSEEMVGEDSIFPSLGNIVTDPSATDYDENRVRYRALYRRFLKKDGSHTEPEMVTKLLNRGGPESDGFFLGNEIQSEVVDMTP